MEYASFDEIRPRLEKQYENAEYCMEGAWDEQRMRAEWSAWQAKIQMNTAACNVRC